MASTKAQSSEGSRSKAPQTGLAVAIDDYLKIYEPDFDNIGRNRRKIDIIKTRLTAMEKDATTDTHDLQMSQDLIKMTTEIHHHTLTGVASMTNIMLFHADKTIEELQMIMLSVQETKAIDSDTSRVQALEQTVRASVDRFLARVEKEKAAVTKIGE